MNYNTKKSMNHKETMVWSKDFILKSFLKATVIERLGMDLMEFDFK